MNSLKYVQDEILIESDSSLQRVELMRHLKVQVQELICYVNVNVIYGPKSKSRYFGCVGKLTMIFWLLCVILISASPDHHRYRP